MHAAVDTGICIGDEWCSCGHERMRAGDNNSAAQHTAVNILLCQQSGGRESAMFATYRTRARDDIRAVSPAVNPGRGTTACRPRCADHGLSPTSALAAPRAVLKCSSAASRQGGAFIPGAFVRWLSIVRGFSSAPGLFPGFFTKRPGAGCMGSVVKSESGGAVVKASHQACARSTDSGKRRQKRPAILSAVSP